MLHIPHFTYQLYFKYHISLELHVNLFKIHGFRNPLLKIHGFRGTHGTHANAATGIYTILQKSIPNFKI